MNSHELRKWLQNYVVASNTMPRMPLIMGILNVTPDSFSDGGKYNTVMRAYDKAMQMVEAGAAIIDVGGASSRPGALLVSVDEELSRVIPVIREIRKNSDISISIDTIKPEVMSLALQEGACMVNDINALRADRAIDIVRDNNAIVCLMHMQGNPRNMQLEPKYDVPIENYINNYLQERLMHCVKAGIKPESVILDPGIGFGKTLAHNMALIKKIDYFHTNKRPILLGVSRKSFIGKIVNREVNARTNSELAITTYAALRGVAIFRTHEVAALSECLQMIFAITN